MATPKLQLSGARADHSDVDTTAGEDRNRQPAAGPDSTREQQLDAVISRSSGWSPPRLLEAALELSLASTPADLPAMFAFAGDRVMCMGSRPRLLDSPLTADQSLQWFPWDLRNVNARRHVFVPDATHLRATPRVTLGSLGIASVVHLPLDAPGNKKGALHLMWRDPRDEWDDCWGAQLRALGAFVLIRAC